MLKLPHILLFHSCTPVDYQKKRAMCLSFSISELKRLQGLFCWY